MDPIPYDLQEELLAEVARHEADLMQYEGVFRVGLGLKLTGGELTETLAICVYTNEKKRPQDLAPDQLIPAELGGLPTDVLAMSVEPAASRNQWDGIVYGGTEIRNSQHSELRPGTMGGIVYDRDTGQPYGISNYHVLIGPSDGSPPIGKIGDTVTNFAGKLLGKIVKYDIDTDSAIFSLNDPTYFNGVNVRYVLGPGQIGNEQGVTGKGIATVGTTVFKSGMTTGLTYGLVKTVYTDKRMKVISLDWGKAFVMPGDSGSLLLKADDRSVVGLVKAYTVLSLRTRGGRSLYHAGAIAIDFNEVAHTDHLNIRVVPRGSKSYKKVVVPRERSNNKKVAVPRERSYSLYRNQFLYLAWSMQTGSSATGSTSYANFVGAPIAATGSKPAANWGTGLTVNPSAPTIQWGLASAVYNNQLFLATASLAEPVKIWRTEHDLNWTGAATPFTAGPGPGSDNTNLCKPALATFMRLRKDGRPPLPYLYMAWANSNNTISLISTSHGAFSGGSATFTNLNASSAPALATFDNRLYLAWREKSGGIWCINSATANDWSSPVEVTAPGTTSANYPAMAAFKDRLYVLWTKPADQGPPLLQYATLRTGDSQFSPPQNIGKESTSSVSVYAMAAYNERLYAVWVDGPTDSQNVYISSIGDGATKATDWAQAQTLPCNPYGAQITSLALAAFGPQHPLGDRPSA